MKYILGIIIILISGNLNAQWVTQTSGTTSTIRDISFVNSNTGFFCGDGVIGKTTNAGQNWVLLNHPATNKLLWSINPINENLIYCVGWFETILKSTNGGSNWIEIRNGPVSQGHSYFCSYFINSETGWIAGSGQKVLKTTNGGSTLDSIYLFTGFTQDIYFKNSSEGILCGEGGEVLKSTNGGLNWYSPNINLNGILYNFNQLAIVNNQTAWLIGNANPVYRSTDFGENWDSIGYVTGSDEIYSCFFRNDTLGWAGGTFGRLFKSTDGGVNWKQENTVFFNAFYRDILFLNDTVGWICGGGGRIQYTTSGGEMLTSISNISNILPEGFKLKQNYPNPFNPTTIIKFAIPKSSFVKLIVYDVLGREASKLVNENLNAGSYEYEFDGTGLNSGVYFYMLEAGLFRETRRMVLVK